MEGDVDYKVKLSTVAAVSTAEPTTSGERGVQANMGGAFSTCCGACGRSGRSGQGYEPLLLESEVRAGDSEAVRGLLSGLKLISGDLTARGWWVILGNHLWDRGRPD